MKTTETPASTKVRPDHQPPFFSKNAEEEAVSRSLFFSPGLHQTGGGSAESPSDGSSIVQTKLTVNTPGDGYEREADAIADQVMHTPVGGNQPVSKAPEGIQREDKPAATSADTSSKVLSEGASLAYEQLGDKPGFEEWKEAQTKKLKYKLWDSQPAELKGGVIGFGLAGAGLLGTTLALNPEFRQKTLHTFNDVNVALPLSLLPYSEYWAPSSFKYKLPNAANAPYSFETEYSFDAFFKLARERWGGPKISLSVGVASQYSQQEGFQPFTGGNFKLKFGGGIVQLSGFYNQPLPPSPVLINDPRAGESPTWLMRSLPGQLEENLPVGSGIFLSVDILRIPQLFQSSKRRETPGLQRKCTECEEEESTGLQRKEKGADAVSGRPAPPIVGQVLDSGGGMPIDKGTRGFMEERFGRDFSQVRIHADGRAAESARAINARAYTSGHNIVFGSGEYAPGTDSGKHLLAHELAHVGQQSDGLQRRETTADDSQIETEIRNKLEEGHYGTAYLQMQDLLEWSDSRAMKAWLAKRPAIRYLFLKQLPATVVADVYSADELIQKSTGEAFSMIDCWYQTEQDKIDLYAQNLPLFDRLLTNISPFSGETLNALASRLTAAVESKKYTSDKANAEFHTIHLLTPSVERKIRFYNTYEGLFKAVSKKFDPFTGLTLATMEQLTDTNSVDREKALEIYNILKALPEEQRRAFLDTALFAGMLESDKDAEKYFKKKFKAQYKALPHNWDAAIWPWEWGRWNAPFAERLTVDHAAQMTAKMNYEDKEGRKFGFDRGIDSSTEPEKGKTQSDTKRLIAQLTDDANFTSPERLALMLAIAVRGRLEDQVTRYVLTPKNEAGKISPALLAVIESYGFIAADGFKYHSDKAIEAVHDTSQTWYVVKKTLFGGKSGSVLGEQRGTFDLFTLQNTEDNMGSLGGLRIGGGARPGDDYYNTTWLDEAVKSHSGSETLLANLAKTQGVDRRGKIFASIRNDIRQANIYAATLPVDSLNYFANGTLYRAGKGALQGLEIHLSWTKDTSESDNEIKLVVQIANTEINGFQMVAPKSTLAIGQIGMKGLRITLSQKEIPAAKGLFIGLLKNADFTLNALLSLLPNVLTLLPYAVMAMTEEFKGVKAHKYKDALGSMMQFNFASMASTLTFTSLSVRNLYDTTAGFLDDFSIAQKNDQGKLIRQGLSIRENQFWTVDASINIKKRLKTIDEKIRAEKAELVGSTIHSRLLALEAEREKLLTAASDKALRYENRDEEMNRLREIMREMRRLNKELDEQFDREKTENPLFNPLTFQVLESEKARLMKDLEYLDKQYFEDKKLAEGNDGGIERYEARKRKAEFEAKYKSFDVAMGLRGINLHGGNYVRDLINDSLKSLGFQSPQLEGIENIRIGGVDSAFVASGAGIARKGDAPGVGIRRLQLPLVKAPKLAFKTGSMLIEAGSPELRNVLVSVTIDFAENPLDKDPTSPYKWRLSRLSVGYASFDGLTVKVGEADPMLNFPTGTPVQVWDLVLWDYNPEIGNINLKIRDIKAEGVYADRDAAKKSSQKIGFGVDTTLDNETEEGSKNALEIRYNAAEQSIDTQVNIASAWVPTIDVQSPTLSVTSLTEKHAVELTEVQADVKVLLKKDAEGNHPERPTSIEIRKLHVGEISAQGIKVVMREDPDTSESEPGKKPSTKKIQEVKLPEKDRVSVKDINLSGLRVTLGEEGTTLSTLENDASLTLGQSDLRGVGYTEKTAKGSVLKAVSIHKGKFDALTLSALGRNGREYTLREFFKFFGSTRLEGLDGSASYRDPKNSATVGLKGKKNVPISIDYHEAKEGTPEYYSIRLPLSRVTLPALNIQQGEHNIRIPKAVDRAHTSFLQDVDVKFRAFITFGEKDKVSYDLYLDSLDVADMAVFGLEYHNDAKGIHVVFDAAKPLHIPNVKASGFRYSSAKGLQAFGQAGAIFTAGDIDNPLQASFQKIEAELSNGKFLAESTGGRSALDVDIGSLGFVLDKNDNMFITLGAVNGGFPKMTITQTDPKTLTKTVTTLSSTGNKAVEAEWVDIMLGADKNNVIDVEGLKAGGFTVVNTETTTAGEVSTTTATLDSEALGAGSAQVRLNNDKSKEITITDIRGGKIDLGLVSTGPKGKSEKYINLPDPEQIRLEAVHILIESDGTKHITLVKPTLLNFNLRVPSQDKAGDYISIICDLGIDGTMELGDGNFETLSFAEPINAFIATVQDDVPVTISNLRLEYKDTSQSKPGQDEPKKPLTNEQQKLLDLEDAMNAVWQRLLDTPPFFVRGDHPIDNPEFERISKEHDEARKAYEKQKGAVITEAKLQASESMTKKYLDAVKGKVDAKLILFNSTIPLHVENLNGEKYVELGDNLQSNLTPVLNSLIAQTFLDGAEFWKSEALKDLAKGLQRWYIFVLAPSARGLIDAMATGSGIGSLLVLLEEVDILLGPLYEKPSVYGIKIDVDVSALANIFGGDEHDIIGLCETRYKHPYKDGYYNLYRVIEYMNYVSKAIVTREGIEKEKHDEERLKRFATGLNKSESEVSEMDVKEALMELIAYLQYHITRVAKDTILRNIKGVELTADVSLRPEQVINELLKEKKAGSLKFDKGKDSIDNVHLQGEYKNITTPEGSASLGTGPAGASPILIPGATYLSDDKGTKVTYDQLVVAPLNLRYSDEVYKLSNKEISLKGLRLGMLKK